jgi:hypothetical protein
VREALWKALYGLRPTEGILASYGRRLAGARARDEALSASCINRRSARNSGAPRLRTDAFVPTPSYKARPDECKPGDAGGAGRPRSPAPASLEAVSLAFVFRPSGRADAAGRSEGKRRNRGRALQAGSGTKLPPLVDRAGRNRLHWLTERRRRPPPTAASSGGRRRRRQPGSTLRKRSRSFFPVVASQPPFGRTGCRPGLSPSGPFAVRAFRRPGRSSLASVPPRRPSASSRNGFAKAFPLGRREGLPEGFLRRPPHRRRSFRAVPARAVPARAVPARAVPAKKRPCGGTAPWESGSGRSAAGDGRAQASITDLL